jgi:hypothetical protein
MSDAYEARDKQTEEKPVLIPTPFTDESLLTIHLSTIDIELGYGNSVNSPPTEERRNELLKERLDVLVRLMQLRKARK